MNRTSMWKVPYTAYHIPNVCLLGVFVPHLCTEMAEWSSKQPFLDKMRESNIKIAFIFVINWFCCIAHLLLLGIFALP